MLNSLRLATFGLLVCLACQAQPPDHLSIDLEPARWQLLPPAFRSVCVGPDGRNWYTIDPGDSKPSDVEIRAALEREYRENSPQLTGASLALLEPGGRAWFYIKPDQLWGYDGQKWIVRTAATGSKFTGDCPTRGQLHNNLANRFVDGKAWFRDEQGVHTYDGQEWSYAALCPPKNAEPHLPRFAVSPGGKFAVAMTPQAAGQHVQLTNPDLWVWENGHGQWAKREIVWSEVQSTFGAFCVTDQGQLWCTQNGVLRIINLAATPSVLERLPELIAQLDDDDAQIRQQAYETLNQVAEQIQPPLIAALKAATSPEAKRRLTALVDRTNATLNPMLIAGRGTAVPPFLVHAANALFQDEQGRILFSATASTPGESRIQNAIIVVDREGRARQLRGNSPFGLGSSEGRAPIFTSERNTLWVSGEASSNGIARCCDFTTGQIITQQTDLNYPAVLAVDVAGHVFLHGNYFHLETNAPLGVFSPAYPDIRPLIPGETHPITSSEHIVASDGKVWAVRKEGTSRYDGYAWELIHPTSRGQAIPILAGREGVMLCRNNGGIEYQLFENNQLVAVAPLRRLIAAYPKMFAAAFPPSYTPVQRQHRLWISADSHENIWLLEYTGVAAFNGETWIPAPPSIRLSRSSPNIPGSSLMTSVGSGEKVYFSTAFAEIQDEKMLLTAAPHCALPSDMLAGIRDHQGAFWLPAYLQTRTASNALRREHRTIRLGAHGPLEEFDNHSWPFLLDQAGNIWLAKMGQTLPPLPRSHFWIWRDGKIVQEIKIPFAQDMRGIFSDKPGSVYVWTSLGLHHLVADGPEYRGPYVLRQTYAPPSLSISGNAFSASYSELVGLVIPTQPRNLTIIPLPVE